MMGWKRRQLGDYLQTQESECGLMCLAAATAVLGGALSAAEARRNYQGSVRGATVARLCDVAAHLNLQARPVEASAVELHGVALPAILHWHQAHFVLLLKLGSRSARIFDPALGERSLSLEDLSRAYSGTAVSLSPTHAFRATAASAPLNLAPLRAAAAGARGRIVQLLLLSLVLQLAALAVPLLAQLAVNFGAMEGDVQAVAAIAGCMALVYVTNYVVDLWRGALNQKIASHISAFTARNLFRHLMSLPMAWFERRKVSDISTRFDSVDPLRNSLSAGLATLVIDGSLGLLVAALLFLVSPLLAGVVIASVVSVVLCKAAFSPVVSRRAAEAASHHVVESAKRWETFRNIQSLKLADAGLVRERVWDRSFGAYVDALERSQAAASAQQATASLVGGLGSLVMIWIGASLVAQGSLSVGALFAFVLYRRYLADKIGAAVDQLNALWLLRFHLSRLSEVFESEPEPRWNDARDAGDYVTQGEIEMRDVYFRHSAADPYLLRGAGLKIAPGKLTLVTGPSGSGKSTLLRLLAGLHPVSGGEVLVDGVSLASFGPRLLRQSVAAVMQEDELLAGTIYDNVTLFDETPDLGRCVEALRAAEAWDAVRALPMGVHTPVGEGGRMLSAGQRQRLLIARALYRRPRILLLDEATSNLDPESEARIFSRLRQLNSTKVVVSHHDALRRYADAVVVLDGRGLRQLARVVEEAGA
jgi:ATP-binding cassette subfamily B protein RaxB